MQCARACVHARARWGAPLPRPPTHAADPPQVLAGLFWLQDARNSTLLSARNTLGLLFFELMFLSFRAMFVSGG